MARGRLDVRLGCLRRPVPIMRQAASVKAGRANLRARNPPMMLVAALLPFVGSCAVTLPGEAIPLPATTLGIVGAPAPVDARARFRALFCAVLSHSEPGVPDARCNELLWRLPGESPPLATPPEPISLDPHMRLLIVGGAFSDCFRPSSTPFAESASRLQDIGLVVEYAAISGRSSSEFNARIIAEQIAAMPVAAGGPLVVIAHSKGTVDVLEAVTRYPDAARRISAVISVAGAVNGSPLADRYRGAYDYLLRERALGRCSPGDGGFLGSLVRSTRLRWLASNTLPANVHFYSLAAFTTPARLARALERPQRFLSTIDTRNDGQLLAQDQVIPGSTVLGYLNADHWAVAVRMEDEFPALAHRPVGAHPVPQGPMLEAILLLVQQDLAAAGAPQAGH